MCIGIWIGIARCQCPYGNGGAVAEYSKLEYSTPLNPKGFSESLLMYCSQMICELKGLKAYIALNGTPTTELRDVTYHMESHSVTCYPTQYARLNPSLQAANQFTYPGGMEG